MTSLREVRSAAGDDTHGVQKFVQHREVLIAGLARAGSDRIGRTGNSAGRGTFQVLRGDDARKYRRPRTSAAGISASTPVEDRIELAWARQTRGFELLLDAITHVGA